MAKYGGLAGGLAQGLQAGMQLGMQMKQQKINADKVKAQEISNANQATAARNKEFNNLKAAHNKERFAMEEKLKQSTTNKDFNLYSKGLANMDASFNARAENYAGQNTAMASAYLENATPYSHDERYTVDVRGKKFIVDKDTHQDWQENQGNYKLSEDGRQLISSVTTKNETTGDMEESDTIIPAQSFRKTYGANLEDDMPYDVAVMTPEENRHFKEKGTQPTNKEMETYRTDKAKADAERLGDEATSAYLDEMDSWVSTNEKGERVYKTDFTGADLTKAKKIQGKDGLGAVEKKEIAGKIAMHSDANMLASKIIDSGVEFSLKESWITAAKSVVGTENVEKLLTMFEKSPEDMSKKERAQYNKAMDKAVEASLKRVEIDTGVNDLVSNYVKLISGAAVTDEERKNFYKVMTGGGKGVATTSTLITALTSWGEGLEKNIRSTLGASKRSAPADYISYSMALDENNSMSQSFRQLRKKGVKNVSDKKLRHNANKNKMKKKRAEKQKSTTTKRDASQF